jgi:hypothetical protein
MATYKVTLTFKTETKMPRRGERETLRDQLLRMLDHAAVFSPSFPEGISLATRRSLVVKRVR